MYKHICSYDIKLNVINILYNVICKFFWSGKPQAAELASVSLAKQELQSTEVMQHIV